MTDDKDDRFDMWLTEQARGYHEPPPAPREEMWARIQRGGRAAGRPGGRDGRPIRRAWVWIPLAAAATLAFGIGLGWWLKPAGPAVEEVADAAPPAAPNQAFEVAATQFLGQTEVFLTAFRAGPPGGGVDPALARRARNLLATTRLLLDSPAASDARLRLLLDDLELVLAEIAALTGERAGEEAEFIRDGLEQRGLLPRLRTVVPAGPMTAGS